ncbi:GntR family transcriptional regulator [Paracoccus stylophorae]|uniref:GntR family transcriptional regulator n=1 Tax=Paracoccus stylophorae TaxID=659350 RepID=A0ABY7SYY6_9RHOB|nr:GntR family transcriptional regulator [Paracoccus stylophorae]WCR12272.1 GntR family transcriptional regulator [Paracoccus stylophorae]
MALVSNTELRPLDDGTVRRRVVQLLTDHIVRGDFAPGQRLTEQQLANALNVSRGPLREAIRELAEIGLLVSLPYKGLYVRSVTHKDLEELYSLRTALETFAFERCWDKRTDAAKADLRQRSADLKATIDIGLDGARAIEQELHLHSWCFELSEHSLLMKSWKSMRVNVYFYFSLHQQALNRKGPLRQSHDQYVDRACGDSLSLMLAHLKGHMRQGLETTVNALSEELFA